MLLISAVVWIGVAVDLSLPDLIPYFHRAVLGFVEAGDDDDWPLGLSWMSHSYYAERHALPIEYQLIGKIEHYWERAGVVGIRLAVGAELHAGQEIAIRLPEAADKTLLAAGPFAFLANFARQTVEEALLSSAAPPRASGTSMITVKTALSKEQARRGAPVYVIVPELAIPPDNR